MGPHRWQVAGGTSQLTPSFKANPKSFLYIPQDVHQIFDRAVWLMITPYANVFITPCGQVDKKIDTGMIIEISLIFNLIKSAA